MIISSHRLFSLIFSLVLFWLHWVDVPFCRVIAITPKSNGNRNSIEYSFYGNTSILDETTTCHAFHSRSTWVEIKNSIRKQCYILKFFGARIWFWALRAGVMKECFTLECLNVVQNINISSLRCRLFPCDNEFSRIFWHSLQITPPSLARIYLNHLLENSSVCWCFHQI